MRLAIRTVKKRKSVVWISAAQDFLKCILRSMRQASVALLETPLILPQKSIAVVDQYPP